MYSMDYIKGVLNGIFIEKSINGTISVFNLPWLNFFRYFLVDFVCFSIKNRRSNIKAPFNEFLFQYFQLILTQSNNVTIIVSLIEMHSKRDYEFETRREFTKIIFKCWHILLLICYLRHNSNGDYWLSYWL